jgi:hypothetical protein
MTNAPESPPFNPVELIILARSADNGGANHDDLRAAITELAIEVSSSQLNSELERARDSLAKRTLIRTRRTRRKNAAPSWGITEAGKKALRETFALKSAPTWSKIYNIYLPAFGLGITPVPADKQRLFGSSETIVVNVLRAHLNLGPVKNLSVLCDELIAEALGMDAKAMTLEAIRGHVLERLLQKSGLKVSAKIKSAKDLQSFAGFAAREIAKASPKDVSLLTHLRCKGLYRIKSIKQSTSSTSPPVSTAPPAASQPKNGNILLTAVQEAIPRIGTDGRYGPEKVFVSALWHSIERDNRANHLSLDRFKHWLLEANRSRLIDLARADLVGAMDPKLVEESEIRDFGSTFHFVLDRQAELPGNNKIFFRHG